MNYELEVSGSLPAEFNSLDGTVPPLVAGSGSATRLTAPHDTAFPAFSRGYEDLPFTLEVWFLPLSNTGELVVIGHDSKGVLWDGARFILRVRQGDGTTITEGTWTPPEIKSFYVVMTYTQRQVQLFVDGSAVASLELPTAEFFSSGQPISLNRGNGSGVYDSLALYHRVLSGPEIAQHYAWGREVLPPTDISMAKGATTWSLTYQNADVLETVSFAGDDFSAGYSENIGVEDGVLRAGTADGGIWRNSIILPFPNSAGIHVTYEGAGANFSYSLNGVDWIASPNKLTILEDAVLTSDVLYIQLELVDDASWVSLLRLDALESRTLNPLSGNRRLLFKSASLDQTPGSQLDYHVDGGASLVNGILNIEPDGSENPINVRCIEMWAKINSGEGRLMRASDVQRVHVNADGTLARSGTTIYRNGAPVNTSPSANYGIWEHYVFVLNSPVNSEINIGNVAAMNLGLNVNIGHLAVYEQHLTAADIAKLYAFNVGSPALRVNDASVITATETDPSAQIYAYSWSYVSGGS